MGVDLGLGLLKGPPEDQTEKWIEDLESVLPDLAGSFRSLWMTDHFFWNGEPTYEAWTVMAYVAGRFSDFEVGSMVLGQSYRNPALLAKMAATLQALSNGRLILGVGAGWKEDEYLAYDFPFPSAGTRIGQLEETIEILGAMWTQPGPVSYAGKYYAIRDAYCEPRPDPVPTIMVGGGGRKTMLVAARRADWWNLSDASIATYRDRVSVLHDHCRAIGRDPQSLRLTWFGRLCVAKTQEAAEELGRGTWTRENAFVGTPMQVVEQMRPFIDLGVDYFMLEVQDIANPSTLALVMEQVLPALDE